jgi:CrcB protein
MGSIPLSLASIAVGATLGAWLRWGFSLWLNARLPMLPLGTLAANLVGAYLIGMAVGFFNDWPQLSPEWRLLAITGFLGGLTTFSTFSAEAMVLLQQRDYLAVMLHAGMHLLGSVALCIAGLATWRWLSA